MNERTPLVNGGGSAGGDVGSSTLPAAAHLSISVEEGNRNGSHATYEANGNGDHAFSSSSSPPPPRKEDDLASTLASVAGNVLEWYDFAIYGYFSDIIGLLLLPPASSDSAAIIESFLIFGGAFLVRPIGGVLMGWVGDTLSRKRALEISIFLMAGPTFAMGCLPTFERWGYWSVACLVAVRLLQGLSVGGQLMSSLVFVAEGHDRRRWGWYGSFAMTAANIGTFLGGVVGFGMRHYFTREELSAGYWRIPFLCGVFVSVSGFYLKHHVRDHEKVDSKPELVSLDVPSNGETERRKPNPLQLALSKRLRGSLISATAAVFLWSGGFYVVFVWLVICMRDLLEKPIEGAFAINAVNLFVTMVAMFPFAGALSDRHGRKKTMYVGAAGLALSAPSAMSAIGSGDPAAASAAQFVLGCFLCLYGAPLCAFLVEHFPPESRLTSVAIGYNTSMAFAGGLSPSLATWLVREYGPAGAGWLLSTFAVISLCGVYSTPDIDYSY